MCINPPRIEPQRRAAFTLMEVVIALTILGLITGTLFAIIQGSVRGAAQIEQLQRENDAINRFFDLCRKTFTTLPSTATLSLVLLDPNAPGGSAQELTISGSPNCFGFGFNPISYEDTIFGLRPDPKGVVDANGQLISYLCLSRADLIQQNGDRGMAFRQETTGLEAPDEQGRYWMPLLPDVVQLKWRFYKESNETWVEEWSDSNWPDLIEVQLLMRDRLTPLRMVYSVPVIQIVAGQNRSATSTNTRSTSAGAPANNGGGQGGGGGASPGGGRGSGQNNNRGGSGRGGDANGGSGRGNGNAGGGGS